MSNKQKVGIKEIFTVIQNVQKELGEVKETLNNGIVARTEKNTEAINKLSTKIENIEQTIKNSNQYKKGRKSAWNYIFIILSSVGSTLITILTILYYFQKI